MLKKKCPSCAKKIEKKFNFCPYCGLAFKALREEDDFGMLGRDDVVSPRNELAEMKLPFGIDRMVNSLIKQLEKQMEEGGTMGGLPKGVKIQISRKPSVQKVVKKSEPVEEVSVSVEEQKRRDGLKKEDAESKMKRIGDLIIYEISAPGVKKKEDVAIAKLEQGLEIRVYTKDTCYVKTIPLKVEVFDYRVESEKVVVEIKG